ncbi:hypothetical protein FLL45_14235 [Aliikangiella marina]|uniref:Uncharacterized protein n=1 Tax=Aliikangiella marina TaxID=1712262 RepID=A0A545T9Y3_9GAMM|nr:hypothetical protein [Aliikangiella marina]TQV74014.1 hypothetical protein FLL45_14235 [Aliikangiella marina]
MFGFITLTVCSKELYLAVYEPLNLNMHIAFLFVGLFFYLNSLSVTYDKALSAMTVVSAVGMLASLYQSYIAILENGQSLSSSMALIIYTGVTSFTGLLHKRRAKKCYSAI